MMWFYRLLAVAIVLASVHAVIADIGPAVIQATSIELGAAGDTDTTIDDGAAGEATIEGDAIKHAGKQMLWIPASAMRNSATSSASCGDTYDSGASDITITVCAFDTGATEERAEFTLAMPKAWDESTITFIPISTCVTCLVTETIQYELACVAVSNGETLNGTLGTPGSSSATLPATPANLSHVGAESGAITIGGTTPAENDLIHCRISRDTSVDNGTGDALLIGIKLFWTDNASTLAE